MKYSDVHIALIAVMLGIGTHATFFREICASEYTMQLPAILCIIIIRFKRLENCEGLRSRVWVILLTCKSCLAASAPALVLKVTKPTGCKERNYHELVIMLDMIFG